MNVDEAMAYASKDKCFWTGEVHTALETLAAEVERLRAELAAAKAASVCPGESAIWILAAAAKLENDGESSGFDSMTKAASWLRERIKERGEG